MCSGAKILSYLHVCVVRWGEGLIHWCGAAPFTAIGIVTFGIDDPLAPTELLEVHPHVHLPAQRTLPLLLCGPTGWSSSSHSLLVLVVSLDSAASLPRSGPSARQTLLVQADVLGALRCMDECRHSLAAWILSGENHHHDPVSSGVVHFFLLPLLLHLGLVLLHPLCGVPQLQPMMQHLRHVEHLPGGGGDHGTGVSSQAAQEQSVLWAVHA